MCRIVIALVALAPASFYVALRVLIACRITDGNTFTGIFVARIVVHLVMIVALTMVGGQTAAVHALIVAHRLATDVWMLVVDLVSLHTFAVVVMGANAVLTVFAVRFASGNVYDKLI